MTGAELAALARLGRRTARREWKRTLLVVLLVAVPISVAVTVGAVVRTVNPTPQERLRTTFGQADLTVQASRLDDPTRQELTELLAELPPGVQVTTARETAVRGDGYLLEVTDANLTLPLHEGRAELVAGRTAAGAREVTVTRAVAQLEDVGVGDQFTAASLGTHTVTGIVEYPGDLRLPEIQMSGEGFDRAMSVISVHRESSGDSSTPRDGVVTVWSIGGLDESATRQLAAAIGELASGLAGGQVPHEAMPESRQGAVAPGNLTFHVADLDLARQTSRNPIYRPEVLSTLVAALLLVIVAFVAATAYATGARRRLRELGLLSANGATPAHVRTAMLGEAATAGVIGGVVGIGLGVTTLWAGRDLLQRIVAPRIEMAAFSSWDVAGPVAMGLVAVLVAAWHPAHVAARVPTTSALQGRMPLSQPRRWVAPLGIAATTAGALLTGVALAANGGGTRVDDRLANAAAIVGIIGAIGGTALLTGPIVAALGRRADRLPATLRLVVRDAARQRARTAAATSAAMVLLLVPVLLTVNLATADATERAWGLPGDPRHLLVSPGGWHLGGDAPEGDLPDEAVAQIVDQLPAGTQHATLTRLAAGDDHAAWLASPDGNPRHVFAGESFSGMRIDPTMTGTDDSASLAVATLTPQVRQATGIPDSVDDDVVVLGRTRRSVPVRLPGGQVVTAREVPAHVPTNGLMPRVLVSPDVVDTLELERSGTQALLRTPEPLDPAAPGPAVDRGDETMVQLSYSQDTGMGWPMAIALSVGVAGLVVLAILGLVTALSATESDHQLGAMVAIGAAPSLRRRFLGLQAGLYALVGALLATPLALVLTRLGMSDALYGAVGPFDVIHPGDVVVPLWPLVAIVGGIPLLNTAGTALLVRSARVQPPRRIA